MHKVVMAVGHFHINNCLRQHTSAHVSTRRHTSAYLLAVGQFHINNHARELIGDIAKETHLADALDYYEERCEEKQCIPLHAHQRLLPGALSFSLIP